MKATLTLSNARIYNVTEIMVLTGQGFNLKLDPEGGTFDKLSWFSDNDPALTIEVKESGMEANLISELPGKASILIMDSLRKITKELTINVVEVLPIEADILELTAEVLPKTGSLQ